MSLTPQSSLSIHNGNGSNRVPSTQLAAGMPPWPLLILDGTNIVRSCRGDLRSGMALLLGIASEAASRATDVLMVFDANMPFILKPRRDASEIYARLIRFHSYYAVECTGGTPADEIILAEADRAGGVIISNDRFSDAASRYSWLKKNNRTVRFNQVRDHVHVGKWIANIPVNLWVAFSSLEQKLARLQQPKQRAA